MRKILAKQFFNRPSVKVAKDLLGKYLVRRSPVGGGKKEIALVITEVEAYEGFRDKASHAHRGKTARNKIMFGEAGQIYVYFTYGIHWMLNIVTGKKDYPAAVLIRGAGEIKGPARLTKFLKIDKKLNTKPLGKKAGLWIEDRGLKISARAIKKTPRIGVEFAGKFWARKPYRFLIQED